MTTYEYVRAQRAAAEQVTRELEQQEHDKGFQENSLMNHQMIRAGPPERETQEVSGGRGCRRFCEKSNKVAPEEEEKGLEEEQKEEIRRDGGDIDTAQILTVQSAPTNSI